MNAWIASTLRILLIASIPVAVVLTNVRLVMLPWYHNLQYDRPTFPPDHYGFTREERGRYAGLALEFLLNDTKPDFMSKQILPDGTPLYNERELRHMHDVKVVTRMTLAVWKIALIVVLSTAISLAWGAQTRLMLRSGIMLGSAIVIVFLLLLGIYILFNFNSFFTRFHQVLFEQGTWTFFYSDTLIRLFPIKFWSDASILVAGASLLNGLLLWWAAYRIHT